MITLDSGAFSAWQKGETLDLDAYISFVKRWHHLIDRYVTLDVIPGADGRRECRPEHIERAAAQSYRNHQRMKDAGLSPIPVFHEDEPWRWLEKYRTDGEPYIALSPYTRAHRYGVVRWCDDAFAILSDAQGQPLVKTHGLGMTAPLALRRYPWTSVDSRRWLYSGTVGLVPVPMYSAGRPNYSLAPQVISVTDRSRGRPNHIEALDDFALDRVHRFLNEQVNVDLVEVRYSLAHRWRAWIVYFKGVETCSTAQIIFVSNTTRQQREVLAHYDVPRLFSYFELKHKPDDWLEKYVAGHMPSAPNARPRRPDWRSPAYWDAQRLALYRRHKNYQRRRGRCLGEYPNQGTL